MLYDLQYSFCQHRSCETHYWSPWIDDKFDKNIQSDLANFAKAFDTVPIKDFHTTYSGMVCKAIAISDGFNPSSPSEHSDVVQDGVCYSTVMVTSGVPQGSFDIGTNLISDFY